MYRVYRIHDTKDVQDVEEVQDVQDVQGEQDAQDADFESWLATLSDDELNEIDARCSLPLSTDASKRGWRKTFWAKNIQGAKA